MTCNKCSPSDTFNKTLFNLASLVRGLYGRVARKLDIDPSYVSRVARGERQSEVIKAALEREMKRIMGLSKTKHGGAGYNRAGKKRAAKKGNKKVPQ
jgi:hypothetical protein